MCKRVECQRCHKPTWAGCGQHIETALAGVAKEDRCSCERDSNNQPKYVDKEEAQQKPLS